MSLSIEELDGIYEIHTETTDNGARVDGDGRTEIKNGFTFRKDKNGFIWESQFTIAENDGVWMKSTIDPSHAQDTSKFIYDEKGNPTKAMMTYKTFLKVRRLDGRLILEGRIHHGDVATKLVMTKI
ncbi:MAG: hypothetical protein PW788_12990 [Micavibrio sp.]|nr:hypothetical protein [Micavibrio sp.]